MYHKKIRGKIEEKTKENWDRCIVHIGITNVTIFSDFIQSSNEIQKIHLLTELHLREQHQLDMNSVHFQQMEMNL